MAQAPESAGHDNGVLRGSPGPRSKGKAKPPSSRGGAEIQVRRPDRAARIISFIELLTVPSGKGQGAPFRLEPWQKDFIRDIYEPHNGLGRRMVRRAILSVARKNGKTALIAGLVLAHLVGPEAIPNGEIYSAANDREQAAQVFKVARQIIDADPELGRFVKIVPSTKSITCPSNGSFYRAISAEAGTKHGLNPSVWIYDELAQAKTRDLYEVLDTSMGARDEPLGVVISTQSPDPQHILSLLIDDGLNAQDPTIVCHLHTVPDECENVFDPSVWKLANPALGTFRDMDDFRALADKAERNPVLESSFRNLYLNQRIDAQAPLITRSEWTACQTSTDLIDGEAIYLGLDLSASDDLTALVAISADPKDDRVKAWFWKPGDTLKEHARRDRAHYDVWAKEGWIDAPPGRTVDYSFVASRIADICKRYEVRGIAYDRWRIDFLLKELSALGLAAYAASQDGAASGEGVRIVSFGQNFHDMAPAIDALAISVADRKFKHDGNPLLAMCFANAVAILDSAGNRKLDKSRSRLRIDGAVATVMAKGLKARDMIKNDYQASPWDDPNFSMVM